MKYIPILIQEYIECEQALKEAEWHSVAMVSTILKALSVLRFQGWRRFFCRF